MVEHITIIARRVVEEIEIRISRNVDRPQPISSREIDATPRKRIAPRRPLLLAAPAKVSA